MPIEHKHIVRHTEKTQQTLAESVCMALNKKPRMLSLRFGHHLLLGLAKRKLNLNLIKSSAPTISLQEMG